MTNRRGERRRRARVRQCATCGLPWAMQLIHHPSGIVIVCRHCGAVRRSSGERGRPTLVLLRDDAICRTEGFAETPRPARQPAAAGRTT
jgi:hypothetical protein